jgi:membrane protease YdiL (CAAX protease family)
VAALRRSGISARLADPSRRVRSRLLAFVALTFAWSWTCWLLPGAIPAEYAQAARVLFWLGGIGPGVAAVAMVAIQGGGGAALRTWLGRCLQWRIGWRWIATAFFLPPALLLPAAALHVLLGGSLGPSPASGHLPLAAANLVLILLLGGPLGEEFGWRGWALPALLTRHGWRAASLILGLVWGCWHLPLFFVAGTLQSRLPLPAFLLSTVALSVVFGWLFTRSRGSVLPALVLHTAVNWWAWIVPGLLVAGSQRQLALSLALLVLLAIGLLVSQDSRTAGAQCTPRSLPSQ